MLKPPSRWIVVPNAPSMLTPSERTSGPFAIVRVIGVTPPEMEIVSWPGLSLACLTAQRRVPTVASLSPVSVTCESGGVGGCGHQNGPTQPEGEYGGGGEGTTKQATHASHFTVRVYSSPNRRRRRFISTTAAIPSSSTPPPMIGIRAGRSSPWQGAAAADRSAPRRCPARSGSHERTGRRAGRTRGAPRRSWRCPP